MPGFHNHAESAVTVAAGASAIAGPPMVFATASLAWTATAMSLTFVSAYLGGVFPDTGSYCSIPRPWFNRTLLLVLDLTIALVIVSNW